MKYEKKLIPLFPKGETAVSLCPGLDAMRAYFIFLKIFGIIFIEKVIKEAI